MRENAEYGPITSRTKFGARLQVSRALLFTIAAFAVGSICAQVTHSALVTEIPDFGCPVLLESQGVGPCDVRIPTDRCLYNPGIPNMLRDVERNHFTPRVERLEGPPGSFELEIQYMLNVFPNYHRGLVSLARLAEKRRSEKIYNMKYTASCWFVRAAMFAPDDAKVREIFGLHLSHFGRKQEALKQFLAAEELGANDANNMYNIGLLYFDLRDYDKALDYAKKAYAQGFPLPALRDKLRQAGKWEE